MLDRYGGRHTVTMMPGDGIGPEMMGYVRQVFSLVGAPVDFEEIKLDPTTDNYADLNNVSISNLQAQPFFVTPLKFEQI